MAESAEAEMETRILDFIKKNGKSSALEIAKALRIEKKTVNRHLYNMSDHLKSTGEKPPVWDLKEKTDDPRRSLKTNTDSSRRSGKNLWMTNSDVESMSESSEDLVSDSGGEAEMDTRILDFIKKNGKSTALEIAKALRIEKKTVNRHLYTSDHLKSTGETKPPVSDLKEKTDDPRRSLKTNTDSSRRSGKNLWMTKSDVESMSKSSGDLVSDSGLSQCFNVIQELGEGGYGCVYKVKHKYDGKMYAVKEVTLTDKADSEVKALAQLDHPNIVRYITCWPSTQSWKSRKDTFDQSDSSKDIDIVFEEADESDDVTSGMESLSVRESESAAQSSEINTTDSLDPVNRGYLFIQMEFCEGGTLTTWIREGNAMENRRNTPDIHKIFHEIVCGVEYVHSKNLFHRDLKPDNIFFAAGGKVKIGDFGLVATLTNPDGGTTYRSKGRGTPSYMSPEQKNLRKYDAKTDIFPLALIWFEMLWKISSGMERAKIFEDLRNQRFPKGFSDKHPTEHKFMSKMLSHTPQERPNATEIKQSLDKFFSMDLNVCQKTI